MYKKLKDKNQFKVKRDKQEKKVKNIAIRNKTKNFLRIDTSSIYNVKIYKKW